MIINSIKLKNFRGVYSLEVTDCAARMLVLGPNRAGKTSTLDAIRAVFLGRVVDAAGKALEVNEWITKGKKSAEVIIAFEAAGDKFEAVMRVTKTVSLEIRRPGLPTWTGAPREVRGALWKFLGVTQKHQECGMLPKAYLIGEDIGRMISELGGGGVDQAALDSVLGDNAAWFRAYAHRIAVAPDSTENLMAIGAGMFAERTRLNAKIEDLDARITKLKDELPPQNKHGQIMTVAQAPDIEAALDQLNAERDAFHAELGAASAAPDAAELAKALERARGELAAIGYDALLTAVEAAEAAIEPASAARAEADRVLKDAQAQESDAVHAESQRLAILDRVKRESVIADPVCPTCGQKITVKCREAAQAALTMRVLEAQSALDAASDRHEETLAALEPLRQALKTASDAERATLAARDEAERAKNNAVMRSLALNARIEALSSQEAGAHRPVLEIEADIARQDHRIASARMALESLRKIDERQRMTAERDKIAAEVALLKWAIPLFHSDKANHASALNSLSRDEQGAFLARCNAQLEPFGVALGLESAGKSLAVTFGSIGTDKPIKITQVSGAESFLAQWAVATAFADGGLVLLDEFNTLDGWYKPLMLALLADQPGCLWFASAYAQRDSPDLDAIRAALDPLGVVWLEVGNDTDAQEDAA